MSNSITRNELTVLQAIARNEMNSVNYGVPESATETKTWLWTLREEAYTLNEGMAPMPRGKAFSGTISSLTQKGLIGTHIESDYYQGQDKFNDSTIWLTEEGFKVWKEKEQALQRVLEISKMTELERKAEIEKIKNH